MKLDLLIKRTFGKDARILTHVQFQLLMLATVTTVLGTSLVSPILGTLTSPFAVSSSEIGLLISAFAIPPVVMIPVGGAIADRYGRRPVLILGLLLFGGAGSAISLTTHFSVVLGLRAIQGIGYAFTVPVGITCVRDLYSGGEEATGQGLRLAIGGLSQVVFPIIASVLLTVAWQFPFLLYGLSLPVAVAFYLWFDEPMSTTDPGTHADSNCVDRRTDQSTRNRGQYLREIVGIAFVPRVTAILVCRAILTSMSFAFLTYNSLIVSQVLDGNPRQAAVLVALWGISYTLTATQAGRITAISPGRVVPLLATNLLFAAGLLCLAISPFFSVTAVGAVCIGFGIGIGGSLYRSLISGFAPEELRGGLVGVGESLGRLAGSLIPIVAGLFIGYLQPVYGSPTALQLTLAGIGVFGGALGLLCVGIAYVSSPVGNEDAAL